MAKSNDVVNEKAGEGQTIRRAHGMDNAGGLDLPNTFDNKMGGSVTNLSHSLTGASAVQTGK